MTERHGDQIQWTHKSTKDCRSNKIAPIAIPKAGERWVVHAQSRYEASVELMIMLGWDLEG